MAMANTCSPLANPLIFLKWVAKSILRVLEIVIVMVMVMELVMLIVIVVANMCSPITKTP
jgi:hypothetical protein